MNKLKLLKKSVVIVLALFAMSPMLHSKVIIEGPDGTLTKFDDVKDCDEWGALPDGWDCYD